jgi:hypothetical protein
MMPVLADIIANPLASANDLAALAKYDTLAALQHPNCPPALWWEIAKVYPPEAEASVLFAMMTLEAPERWLEIEDDRLGTRIKEVCNLLPVLQQHLFAFDCAERVLPLFVKAQAPHLESLTNALQSRQLFGQGKISVAEWRLAQELAETTAWSTKGAVPRCVAWAVAHENVGEVARRAVGAMVFDFNANQPRPNREASLQCRYAERNWQWQRLQAYLRGEVP